MRVAERNDSRINWFSVTKQSMKALGEADYKDKVLVLVRKWVEDFDCFWVQIRKGNKFKGNGTVLTLPKNNAEEIKIGDVVVFEDGSERKRPLYSRKLRVRNRQPKLKEQVVQDLVAAMTFNPSAQMRTLATKKELRDAKVKQNREVLMRKAGQ